MVAGAAWTETSGTSTVLFCYRPPYQEIVMNGSIPASAPKLSGHTPLARKLAICSTGRNLAKLTVDMTHVSSVLMTACTPASRSCWRTCRRTRGGT